MRTIRRFAVVSVVASLLAAAVPSAHAATSSIPKWVRPAIRYLSDAGHLKKKTFHPNRPMSRKAFKKLVRGEFGRGLYKRRHGKVTAGEVSLALVKALHKKSIAQVLVKAKSPDGWRPDTKRWFGSEIVARELGLRHDRPTQEDAYEASTRQRMRQADVAWAVWKAKTAPKMYAADALARFDLSKYNNKQRKVVQYAASLVGKPYVWAGEWPLETPSGYPYGSQVHGGFDCSGFVWYVLRAKASNWRPIHRPYKGWNLGERSSAGMAAGTRKRLRYKRLRPADIVFFAPSGRKSKPGSVFHAGIYLGRGWMIHSSGSSAGVSVALLSRGTWWHEQFAWGRRVIKR
jgi:cell wall-associated NlpC family hydrolase